MSSERTKRTRCRVIAAVSYIQSRSVVRYAGWDVAQSDDKSRNGSFREASRLRATLGSEPSSGYAFHDKAIVDRIRPGRGDSSVPQAASHAPRERAFARTLVGGVTLQEALGEQADSLGAALAQASHSQRGSLSAKSWPPVPPELVDAADEPSAVKKTRPSERAPARKSASVAPVPMGGAIWQAMPSVADMAEPEEAQLDSAERSAIRHSVPPVRETSARAHSVSPDPNKLATPSQRSVPPLAITRPGRPSPALHRPSVAELEAEQSHTYGDPRVMKLEKLVERNSWEEIAEQLGSETALSPALRLLQAVAKRETATREDDKKGSAELMRDAISAVAMLLQVPEASPTALVLAKRLLRKNRAWSRAEPAGTGLSAAVLGVGLAVGAGIGWVVTRVWL